MPSNRFSIQAMRQRDELAAVIQTMWNTLVPDCPLATEKIYLWVDRFSPDVLERAIHVTSAARRNKAEQGIVMDNLWLQKYCTKCASREQQERSEASKTTPLGKLGQVLDSINGNR